MKNITLCVTSHLNTIHVIPFVLVAVIFVVDSSNRDRLAESFNELAKLVQEKELKEASLLIFANKQVILIFVYISLKKILI